ncbi:nucleoside diphosphate kinase [Ceraceosorus guamensis]|uniref:Nucleoside diphosphate kinase n=1 Tax=Ceraceosorus guamensis TaxID=1522189 RepID=A0A316VWN1_9BASI|nr:nucleoside diphosphate kinase [Ceraceosorus guamensis]PWN42026.1 nucleoside diphosphate kinase [Ceraceosorus guamensis]
MHHCSSSPFPSISSAPRPFKSTTTHSNNPARPLHTPPTSAELTLAILKPSLCSYQPDVSAVLKELKFSGLNPVRSRRMQWTRAQAEEFYQEHRGRFYYDRLVLGMSSGPSLSLALYGPNSIKAWRGMLGATKACRTKWEAPQSLRGRYGITDTRNGFHGSDSPESAKRELGLIFDGWDTDWWMAREARLSSDQGAI